MNNPTHPLRGPAERATPNPNAGMKKTWEIWVAGTEPNTATKLGTSPGDSFLDACRVLASVDGMFRQLYDSKTCTYQGRRVFNTESAAKLASQPQG